MRVRADATRCRRMPATSPERVAPAAGREHIAGRSPHRAGSRPAPLSGIRMLRPSGPVCAAAILACIVASPAAGPGPRPDDVAVATVDLYGLRTVPDSAARRALGIAAGAPVPDSAARAAAVARVESLPGVRRARLTVVCCTPSGGAMVYLGISEAGVPEMRLAPAPTGAARLPGEVVAAGAALAFAGGWVWMRRQHSARFRRAALTELQALAKRMESSEARPEALAALPSLVGDVCANFASPEQLRDLSGQEWLDLLELHLARRVVLERSRTHFADAFLLQPRGPERRVS